MSPPGHDRAAGLDAPNPLSLYLKRLAPSSQSTPVSYTHLTLPTNREV